MFSLSSAHKADNEFGPQAASAATEQMEGEE